MGKPQSKAELAQALYIPLATLEAWSGRRHLSGQQEELVCPARRSRAFMWVVACVSCQCLLNTLTGARWWFGLCYILHPPNAVMVLARFSVAALTWRPQAESTELYLAHCFRLSKTGKSFWNSLKSRGSGGLWLIGKDGSGGEGAVDAVEGCLVEEFSKSCSECCSKLRRRSLAQILSWYQMWSQELCLQWMAGVRGPFLSIYWCMHMHSAFMLLCSAGFHQTVESTVDENLRWMVGVFRERTPNLILSVPL